MTTENNPRELGELLSMNTYQGMTDEEIQMIIDDKVNRAYAKGNRDAVNSQSFINLEESKKRSKAVTQQAMNVLQSIERASEKLLNGVNS